MEVIDHSIFNYGIFDGKSSEECSGSNFNLILDFLVARYWNNLVLNNYIQRTISG